MLNYSKLNNISLERLVEIYQDNLVTSRERERVEKIINRKLDKEISKSQGKTRIMLHLYSRNKLYKSVKLAILKPIDSPSKQFIGFPLERGKFGTGKTVQLAEK